jgi:uncharacterized membrane protein
MIAIMQNYGNECYLEDRSLCYMRMGSFKIVGVICVAAMLQLTKW